MQVFGTVIGCTMSYINMQKITTEKRDILLAIQGTNVWSGQMLQLAAIVASIAPAAGRALLGPDGKLAGTEDFEDTTTRLLALALADPAAAQRHLASEAVLPRKQLQLVVQQLERGQARLFVARQRPVDEPRKAARKVRAQALYWLDILRRHLQRELRT